MDASFIVEVIQSIALAAVGVGAIVLGRGLRKLNAKVDGRTQVMKDLYERSRRTLNEHIRAPIHRR